MKKFILTLLLIPALSFGQEQIARMGAVMMGGTPAANKVSVSDNFNRTDENPLGNGNWTTLTGLAGLRIVSNNALSSTDDSNYNASYWSSATFNDAQFSQVTVKGTNRYEGVMVRASSSTNTYYYFRHVGTSEVCQLFKVVAGSPAQLGADYGTAVAPTTIRLEISGTTLTPYIGGVAQATRTDSDIASGAPGAWAMNSGGNAVLDDWSGGDL